MSPIIRINNGALRLGAGKLSLITPAPLELPFQANLRHWYDFTDIGVLFQDTEAASPVTTNGQQIVRVNDKGSDCLNLVATGTTRTFDSASNAWSTAFGTGNLNATLASYSFPPPQTFFCIYRNTGTSIGVVYHISNTAGFELDVDGDFKPQGTYNNVGSPLSSVNDTTDVWYALMAVCRANNTQDWYHSNITGFPQSGSVTAPTITTGSTNVGAFNSGNSSHHLGDIAEVGAYNIDDGDEATIFSDFQAYTEEKYSIVWA